jgi:hypothetical protein
LGVSPTALPAATTASKKRAVAGSSVEHARVVLGESPRVAVARALDQERLGQRLPQPLDARRLDLEDRQVGVGEVAVVVGALLHAHGDGRPLGVAERTRLLDDLSAARDHLGLARDLEDERAFDVAERIDVLDLDLRAELRRADRPDRDVGVAAQRPLLHVALGDAGEAQQAAQRLQIGRRLGGGGEVGHADDLDERHAGAVQVDQRGARPLGVERLAGVLLHVDSENARPLRRPLLDLELTRRAHSGSSNWLI